MVLMEGVSLLQVYNLSMLVNENDLQHLHVCFGGGGREEGGRM